ncbi:flagellin [Agarilytica rhodophyticola]|uniref:flagellin N-terminal helical domain-containing protein n=1 Tax=Agarilytica rhodophyticola TaxID=1737490 RepID=UPI000B341B2B|nr:flagellin [Agarilytica rhodophyticola]
MTLVVNTNVSSLNAQRQLLQSGADLDRASERLASGRRINSAADDAAGLAISNRQTSQIRGLDQAVRNANDGISLIQTAEGALDEVTNILQRSRELAIQSANGIFSDADRATLDAEVQQLKAEIDRIAETTAFNGQNILDGSLGNIALQVGSESNQTIDFTVSGFSTSSLGGSGGDVIGEGTAAGIADLRAVSGTAGLTINDVAISALTTANATNINEALALINADLDGKGAEVASLVTLEADTAGDGVLVAANNESFDITLTDGDGEQTIYRITDTNNIDELVNKINTETTVSASLDDNGKLILSAAGAQTLLVADDSASDGASGFTTTTTANFALVFNDTSIENSGVKIEAGTGASAAELDAVGINVQDDDGNLQGATVVAGTAATLTDINAGDLVINGVDIGAISASSAAATAVDNVIEEINKLSEQTGVVAFEAAGNTARVALRSTTGSSIQIKYGDNATAANVESLTGFQEQNAVSGAGSIAGINVSTAASAQSAVDVIDAALETVNAQRSELGAVNNRLDFTVSNLSNISEKTSAARSRIVDADFASETAQLSRAQVLQQASQAILAQANARPQQVLSLLQ